MTVREAVQGLTGDPLGPPEGQEDHLPHLEPQQLTSPAVAPGSVLSQLRARAAQLEAQQTVDLPIPGYDREGLIGRYRATSISRAFAAAGVINPVMPEWWVAADVLASALEQLLLRGEDGEPEAFAEGVTLRYDDDLVEAMELHPEERSARGVLKALFGGGVRAESLISAHFMAYQGWLMSGDETPGQEVARTVVGEPPAR